MSVIPQKRRTKKAPASQDDLRGPFASVRFPALRCGGLMTDGIHEEERQSDVDGAGQRQQDTEDDTDRLRRSAQKAAGEEDSQQRQQE